MQCPCKQLLAGSAFAEQESRDVGRCDLFDHATDFAHALAGSDDAVQRRITGDTLQTSVLGFELTDRECTFDEQAQRVGIDGLLIEVIRAKFNRLQGVFLVAVSGDDDDFGVRCKTQDFLQRFQTFLDAFGIGREAQVL